MQNAKRHLRRAGRPSALDHPFRNGHRLPTTAGEPRGVDCVYELTWRLFAA